MSMSTILIDKICNLVIIGLADVDRFKWCIQFAIGSVSFPLNMIVSTSTRQLMKCSPGFVNSCMIIVDQNFLVVF